MTTTDNKQLDAEVYYQFDQNAWFECEVTDLIEQQGQKLFRVRLLNKHLKDKEVVVPNIFLRFKRHNSHPDDGHVYNIGDQVEVYSQSNKDDIKADIFGWRQGIISNLRGKYVSVEFDSQLHPDQLPQIYLATQIRPHQEQHSINPDHFFKSEVGLTPEIQHWIQQLYTAEYEHERQSFFDQLAIIKKQTQVFGINLSSDATKLIILGPSDKLKKASLSADIFLNSQKQIIEMDRNSKFKQQKAATKTDIIEKEIWVDQNLVGLIVGTAGSQIKKIQEQFNVQIYIDKQQNMNEQKRRITVLGKNEKNVDEACEYISLERAVIPIEDAMIDYVCGHNDANLGYFHDKSDVIALNLDKTKDGKFQLIAVGRSSSLEDLKQIISTHIEYYEKHQQKESQRTQEYKQQRKVQYYEEKGQGQQQQQQQQQQPQRQQPQYQKRGGQQQQVQQQNEYPQTSYYRKK